MDYYNANIEALKNYRPDLYNRLKDYKSQGSYSVISSKHKKKFLNIYDNATGQMGYDNLDPLGDVLKRLDRQIKISAFNIFFGFGLGYELMGLMQNYFHPDAVYIVIDPEIEPFYLAMQNIDLTGIIKDRRVHLFIGEHESRMFLNFHSVISQGNTKLYVKAINIIEHPLSVRKNINYYKSVMQHLKDAVREVLLHFGNDPWDSLIGIENTFLNINEIINNPGIKDLKDVFKNKPGIVVATGPSLSKNIELLRGLENKAVICAADASVRVMKKHGLKPHLVTSLERVIETVNLFDGLTKDDVDNVYLAACPVIRPEGYAAFPGKRIIVYRNFATFKWIDIDKGILDIGPSSGNMAFKVLEYIGCNPIILIGQDLAFGEDGTTHAKGSTFGEVEEYYTKERVYEVEGNISPRIKTSATWYQFLKYYEKDVAGFQGTVINATEGGAKIPGTQIMTFKEAIEKYIGEDIDPIGKIEKNLKYPTEEEINYNIKKTIDKIDYALNYTEKILDRFKEGLRVTERFKNEVIKPYEENGRIDFELAKKLYDEAQLPNKIFSEKDFFEIYMHFVQSYYLTTFVEIFGVLASDLSDIKKNFAIVTLLDDMYIVMVKLIETMKKSLLQMREKLVA
jgi:hypothetical protein